MHRDHRPPAPLLPPLPVIQRIRLATVCLSTSHDVGVPRPMLQHARERSTSVSRCTRNPTIWSSCGQAPASEASSPAPAMPKGAPQVELEASQEAGLAELYHRGPCVPRDHVAPNPFYTRAPRHPHPLGSSQRRAPRFRNGRWRELKRERTQHWGTGTTELEHSDNGSRHLGGKLGTSALEGSEPPRLPLASLSVSLPVIRSSDGLKGGPEPRSLCCSLR